MDKKECPICVRSVPVVKTLRCPHCSYDCCKQCYQTWLLSSDETIPRCLNAPHCQNEFSTMFIFGELPQSFRKKYTQKLGRLSLQVEKQRLPLLQPDAIQGLTIEHWQKWSRALAKYIQRLKQLQWMVSTPMTNHPPESGETTLPGATARKCSREDCSGFLSTRWKCPVCDTYTCSSCCQLTPENIDHECNADDVATVALLRRDTKACPGCSVPIHKIDGCSQMFCVKCFIAFDWNTLRIERGRIHNPHYYEIQRQMAHNGEIPREPGDIAQPNCGRECRIDMLRILVNQIARVGYSRYSIALQFGDHIQSALVARLAHLAFERDTERQVLQQEDQKKRKLAICFLQQRYRRSKALSELNSEFLRTHSQRHGYGIPSKENCDFLAKAMKIALEDETNQAHANQAEANQAEAHRAEERLGGKTEMSTTPGKTAITPAEPGKSAAEKTKTEENDKWESELRNWETSKLKRTEFHDILQTFTVSAIDIAIEAIFPWVNGPANIYKKKQDFLDLFTGIQKKINQLRKLCNVALANVCGIFNCVRRKITNSVDFAPLLNESRYQGYYGYGLNFQGVQKKKKTPTTVANGPLRATPTAV